MANPTSGQWDESSFFDNVETQVETKAPNFSKTLNIAVIGKVSAGKSSLINALLKRSRKTAIAKVGAISGVTTALKILRLDERVRLIDSPGLNDIRKENSQVTQDFLKHIDIGIFVVTGSADATQKQSLEDLSKNCKSVFVVLNKIDEWDRLAPSALEKVISQWKEALQIEKIYPVCTFGYDPETPSGTRLDIRGVYGLREDIEKFLASEGKELLLARHMGEKRAYALAIIATALAAVAAEAFIPGSAAYITATQTTAIISLYYLYTGEILSTKAALAVLPAFAAEAAGTTLFLFVTSFLPPTGVVNIAAAGVAITITLAMLATVNSILESGAKLEEEALLKDKFRRYQKQAENAIRDLALTDITNLNSINLKKFVEGFLGLPQS